MQNLKLRQLNKYCFISHADQSTKCPIYQLNLIQECLQKFSGKNKRKMPFYVKGYEKIPPRDAQHISWPENFLEYSNDPAIDIVFLFNDKTTFSNDEIKEIYRQSGLSKNQIILVIVQENQSSTLLSA